MIIKVFGPGCAKCEALEYNVRQAVKEVGPEKAEIQKISDMEKMIEANIMASPALMIGEEIKASGRIPGIEEIKGWLKNPKN